MVRVNVASYGRTRCPSLTLTSTIYISPWALPLLRVTAEEQRSTEQLKLYRAESREVTRNRGSITVD
jgi:hypothetical protein